MRAQSNQKAKVRGPRQNSRKPHVTGGSAVATFTQEDPRKYKMVYFKDILPPSLVTKLKYIVARPLINVGINTASIQLNANGIFDVDPSLGSTAVPGFVEWTALFKKYRVVRVKSTCTFVNRESFPVLINLGFDRIFYSANAKVIGYFAGAMQKRKILQASPGPGVTLSMTQTAMSMIGDLEGESSANWSGDSGANPSNLFHTSIAATCSNIGAVFVLGLVMEWTCEFDVEFYQPRNLSS